MRGSRVSDFFFTKNPIKNKRFWGVGWGGEVARGMGRSGGWRGGGVNGWTDVQTRTNLPFLGGGLVQGGGAGLSECFHYESKFKIKKLSFFQGWG